MAPELVAGVARGSGNPKFVVSWPEVWVAWEPLKLVAVSEVLGSLG